MTATTPYNVVTSFGNFHAEFNNKIKYKTHTHKRKIVNL